MELLVDGASHEVREGVQSGQEDITLLFEAPPLSVCYGSCVSRVLFAVKRHLLA